MREDSSGPAPESPARRSAAKYVEPVGAALDAEASLQQNEALVLEQMGVSRWGYRA
jgi:hypothetical protein